MQLKHREKMYKTCVNLFRKLQSFNQKTFTMHKHVNILCVCVCGSAKNEHRDASG